MVNRKKKKKMICSLTNQPFHHYHPHDDGEKRAKRPLCRLDVMQVRWPKNGSGHCWAQQFAGRPNLANLDGNGGDTPTENIIHAPIDEWHMQWLELSHDGDSFFFFFRW
jgi:hypothetical protein